MRTTVGQKTLHGRTASLFADDATGIAAAQLDISPWSLSGTAEKPSTGHFPAFKAINA